MIGFALCALLLALGSSAEAQQTKKIHRIGFLSALQRGALSSRIDAFQQGLRELGLEDGKNILIDYRWADGEPQRLSKFAAEFASQKLEVIVTAGPTVTRAAKQATNTIPIVMTQDPDPVGNGFVASLARPGGNITGLSTLAPELSGKQLELLKETIPKLSRVVVFSTLTYPGHALAVREIGLAAGPLNIQLQSLDIEAPQDIASAFQAAIKDRADGLIVQGGAILTDARKRILGYTVKNRLPAIYPGPGSVDAGGLMAYGVNRIDLDRRAATYVDKVLKGRKPADVPVEQPMKFDFVINLKAAQQIGLTIPPNVLVRATRVIK